MDTSCIFCQIIAGNSKSYKVYEDEKCFAFLDIHPINPGHLLLIPKKHVINFYELDDVTYSHLMLIAKKLSDQINKTFKPKKVGLVIAGWDIPHAHIHILPTNDYHDITSKSLLEGKKSNPSEKELEETVNKIRFELADK
ncbi:MAG TPA: HIT family protein [Candidatus Saccharimonadales bacterium]|nr:HIT family protein [Candidatus Saccharimonadales bacterium]